MNNTSTANRKLSYKHMFDAPRELVWEVWTKPEHIALWWGPNGFTNTVYKMDVKPGGVWDYMMHGPDGVDWPNLISYVEVKKPEKLVYDHGDKENPKMFHVRVVFAAIRGAAPGSEATKLTMKMIFPTKEALDETLKNVQAKEGLKQNMDKLEQYLAKMKG
jgi:uncharacterized protein YndB with AHSA1/START domain